MIPTVRITSEEKRAGKISPETLSEATQLFNTNGTLVIQNVLEPELINTMHTAFMERYQAYMEDKRYADALNVGDKRFMVTSTLAPPFSTPALYASPFVAPVMKAFLTDEYILGSFGAVISLPGSKAQHVHRDFPGLFIETGLDQMVPPFAITMVVPLIEIDKVVGPTLIWPKSHRMNMRKFPDTEPEWPFMALGDCLLMDYRLVHGGAANLSDRPRPILYNIYTRPWFRDHVNYIMQQRLDISNDELSQVPKEHRHLFNHVVSGRGDFAKNW